MLTLQRVSHGHALIASGVEIMNRYGLVESFSIPTTKLTSFLTVIESNYGVNPYHNSVHGADVLFSLHLFVSKFGYDDRLDELDLLGGLARLPPDPALARVWRAAQYGSVSMASVSAKPHHATPCHATPRQATPHTTPRHATPRTAPHCTALHRTTPHTIAHMARARCLCLAQLASSLL